MKRTNLLLLICLLTAGCQKAYLEDKPDKSLLVPTTLADCRALLDNLLVFNRNPGITGIADGDFITTDAGWRAFPQQQERNSYIWDKDIYGAESAFEWNAAYQQILYANVVLEALSKLSPGSDPAEYRRIEGTARFFRAWAYYGLTQLYCPPYSSVRETTDLGLPLWRSADVGKLEPRSLLAETYREIFSDLARARHLLPDQPTGFQSRPGLTAVYAFYTRMHLARGAYNQALAYADSTLQRQPGILDYNTVTSTAARPFPVALPNGNNPELIWYSTSLGWAFTTSSAVSYCEPNLYASFHSNDLRRTLYWRDNGGGRLNYRGQYTGSLGYFGGLATDEVYLTRAECRARAGQTANALSDLNAVLSKRYRTGTFIPVSATDAQAVLQLVLAERRKELVGRNLRWSDLRRLASDPLNAVTLVRQLNGQGYTLLPGSSRYTYPIPPDELLLNGLVQNER